MTVNPVFSVNPVHINTGNTGFTVFTVAIFKHFFCGTFLS